MAVFTNELRLDVSQVTSALKGIQASAKSSADNLKNAFTNVKASVNVKVDDSQIKTASREIDDLSRTENVKVDVDTTGADKASGKFSAIGAGIGSALGTAGIQAVSGLATGLKDGAIAADDFGDSLEVAFKQQGIADVDGEIQKVRGSTLQLANDLGLPAERTRQLAVDVASLGGISGDQAAQLTKLSAGLEVFTDGAVKGESVVKAFTRGIADPEGAAAIEKLTKKYPQLASVLQSTASPTEKLAQANKILGTSFETVKKQQQDAGGILNQIQNQLGELFQTVGTDLLTALAPVAQSLIPIISQISPIITQIGSTLVPIIGLLPPIVGQIASAVGTLFQVLGPIITQLVTAFAPIITQIFSVVGDLATRVLTALAPAFSQIASVLAQVLSALSPFIVALGDQLGPILTVVAELVVELLRAFLPLVPLLVTSLVPILTVLVRLLGTGLTVALQTITASLRIANNIFAAVYNAVVGITNGFVSFAKSIPGVSQAFEIVATVVGKVKQAILDLLGFLPDWAKETLGLKDANVAATKEVKTLGDEGKSAADGTASAFKSLNKEIDGTGDKSSKAAKKIKSEFELAKEELAEFTRQQATARKEFENELKRQRLAGTITEAEVKIKLGEFDKKQAEARIAETNKLLKIETDKKTNQLTTRLSLAKDESIVNVLETAKEIKIDAESRILDIEIAAVVKPEKPGNILKSLKKQLSPEEFQRRLLAEGIGVLFPVQITPVEKSVTDQVIGDLANNALAAVNGIDWGAVFKKPTEASDEAIGKITDGIAAGTLTYQDAIKQLSDNIADVPGAFEIVVQQLNNTFDELTQKQITSLATVATSYQKGEATANQFYGALATTAATAFAQIITEQGDYGKATLELALQTLDALIPVLVAQITGINLANPALPFGTGLIYAAGLTAILKGLVAAARASVSGFADGGYTGNGGKYEPAGIVHRGEFVVNKENTSKYRGVLEAMNAGKFSPVVQANDTVVMTGQFNAMQSELSAIRQRLDSMPNGIIGRQSVSLDVGFDTYLYERQRTRQLARRVR